MSRLGLGRWHYDVIKDPNLVWLLGSPSWTCDFCSHGHRGLVQLQVSNRYLRPKEDKAKGKRCKVGASFPFTRKTSSESPFTTSPHISNLNSVAWPLLAAKELRKSKSWDWALGARNSIRVLLARPAGERGLCRWLQGPPPAAYKSVGKCCPCFKAQSQCPSGVVPAVLDYYRSNYYTIW